MKWYGVCLTIKYDETMFIYINIYEDNFSSINNFCKFKIRPFFQKIT